MRRRWLAVLSAVGLALGLSACDGGHPAASPSPTTTSPTSPAPPELRPAWTAKGVPVGHVASRGTTFPTGDAVVYTRPGTTILVGRAALTALDTATGATRWTFTPPASAGHVCGASSEATSTGLVGLLFSTRAARCDSIGVLDLSTGHLLWRRPLDEPVEAPQGAGSPLAQVAVGRRFVAAAGYTNRAAQLFDVRTGRPSTLTLPEEEADAAVGEGWAFVSDRFHQGRYVARNLDTGVVLHGRLPSAADVTTVLSGRPLVLEVETFGFGEAIARLDAHGRRASYVGSVLGVANATPTVDHVAGRVVVEYPYLLSGGLSVAYDAGTGRHDWTLDGSSVPVAGAQGGGLLVLLLHRTPSVLASTWIGRADPADPTRVVQLGRIDGLAGRSGSFGGPSVAWTPTLLLVARSSGVTAYRLPGTSGTAGTPMPGLTPAPTYPAGDHVLDPSTPVCSAISASVLHRLHLDRPRGLPAPQDCSYYALDDVRAGSVDVGAEYDVAAHDRTADATAEASLTNLRTRDTHHAGTTAQRIAGLGDEAWFVPGRHHSAATQELLVRSRNVVLRLSWRAEVKHPDLTPTQVHDGLVAAARQVVAGL